MTAIPKKKRISLRADHDSELLKAAANGSETAFRQLVLAEQQNVRVFLSRYIFCSDHVDDVAQDVFFTAYQKLDQFRNESKFSTWLLGIARNKALQFLRSEMRRKKHCKRYFDIAVIEQRLADLGSENVDLQKARIVALRDCVTGLPNQAKKLIERYYFDRVATSDIAATNDTKEGAIRMKLFRIRKKLAACVASKTSA